jgi:hypothetical protein
MMIIWGVVKMRWEGRSLQSLCNHLFDTQQSSLLSDVSTTTTCELRKPPAEGDDETGTKQS